MRVMTCCLVLLLCLASTHAATFTATPDTFAAQLAQLGPGDTLLLQAGHYGRLQAPALRVPSGRSWQVPVTLQAAPGARVVFERIVLTDVQYVVFDGLIVDAAGVQDAVYLGEGSAHIRFSQGEVTGSSGQGISGWTGVDLQLAAMRVHHNGRTVLDHGVYIAIPDTVIEDSQFYANTGYGIQIYNGAGCCAHRTLIQRNQIYDNTHGGATLNHGNGIVFRANELWQNGGGNVRVSYGGPVGTQILQNLIRDTPQGWGIELSGESQGAVVEGNLLCNLLPPALVDHGQGTRLVGNTLEPGACPARRPAPHPRPAPTGLRVLVVGP